MKVCAGITLVSLWCHWTPVLFHLISVPLYLSSGSINELLANPDCYLDPTSMCLEMNIMNFTLASRYAFVHNLKNDFIFRLDRSFILTAGFDFLGSKIRKTPQGICF